MTRQRIIDPNSGEAKARERRAERVIEKQAAEGTGPFSQPKPAPVPPPTLSEYLARVTEGEVIDLRREPLSHGDFPGLIAIIRIPGRIREVRTQLGSGRGVTDAELEEWRAAHGKK